MPETNLPETNLPETNLPETNLNDLMDNTGFTVVNTRRLAYDAERVFDAFADPKQLVHWWGPHGFTSSFDTFDFRPGGEWRFTMTSESGKSFDNAKDFIEIVRPELIVFRHVEPMHDFTMTMRFQDLGAATLLTWQMDFAPGQDHALKDFIHNANEQNFDRLETHLRTHP